MYLHILKLNNFLFFVTANHIGFAEAEISCSVNIGEDRYIHSAIAVAGNFDLIVSEKQVSITSDSGGRS